MKRVVTIPPDAPFVAELASRLWDVAAKDPIKLANMLVLLPTRRACRQLRTEFLSVMGKAALLPQMLPLGDMDETELYFSDTGPLDIQPAISSLRRQMLLIQLIRKKDGALSLEQSADLAAALAKLLDQVQIERANFADLKNIVPQNLAEHWQETLRFLEIVTSLWPSMLAEEGCIDPAERRNLVLAAKADAWRTNPPRMPVIAAGSTGSVPAVADLLEVIASLPEGMVVLPGLDQRLDEDSWQEVGESHPQYSMKRLIEKLGVKRDEVEVWLSQNYARPHRVRLLQETMRPANTTNKWRALSKKEISESAFAGLSCLELEHQQEEALVIALAMRQALENKDKTAMLVSADRALAAKVSALLRRWDVVANDSAGVSLAFMPVGGFLSAAFRAAKPNATAVEYLSLLKHPLTCCGVDAAQCRKRTREIEIAVWRGLRRLDGWSGAAKVIGKENPELAVWCKNIAEKFAPITKSWKKKKSFEEHLKNHIEIVQWLASSGVGGTLRLWAGVDGEKAAEWIDDLKHAAHDFPPLNADEYLNLFQGLLRGVTVHPEHNPNSRLNILGPLEARLQHADLVILGGLNEGSWPPEADVDPWLSRPMQADFKLPLPERRLGLSAHDFVQLACAKEVLITRSKRVAGTPTVASRFLLQMEAVLQALGYHGPDCDALRPVQPLDSWARHIDKPEEVKACYPPRPLPPVESRPKKLSVTEIGTWMRNPYAIYAKRILGLRKLDEIDKGVTASDRGTMTHEILEDFLRAYPNKLPENALEELLKIARKNFAQYKDIPQVEAFWWPRFKRIAEWFVSTMKERAARGISIIAIESKGKTEFANGSFVLDGRADRIDRLPDGSLEIIDYKTGTLPTDKIIKQGYEPQLALLAAIAEDNGFAGIENLKVGGLYHWGLSGGKEIAKENPVKGNVEGHVLQARAALEELIEWYGKPETPYLAVPRPQYSPRHDDYAHLARVAEWGSEEGEE